MRLLSLSSFLLLSSLSLTLCDDPGSYQARCEVGVTSTNTTLDTCDVTRFLQCKDGRCLCQDQANQIWTSRELKTTTTITLPTLSRSKRAKGSKGKKGGSKGGSGGGARPGGIVAGAAAGAVGGLVAGSVLNSNIRPTLPSLSQRITTMTRTRRHYSCYSRVGGECVLDSLNADTIVSLKKDEVTTSTTTTTTTTTETSTSSTSTSTLAPEINGTSEATSTTTTVTPSTSSSSEAPKSNESRDMTRIPKCVEFAVCSTPPIKIENGVVVSGDPTGKDPRLGVCTCREGYEANSQDLCVKK